jgi:hypothetical protein
MTTVVSHAQLEEIVAAFLTSDVPESEKQAPVRWAPRAWENKLGVLDGMPRKFIDTKTIPRAALLGWGRDALDSPKERWVFFVSVMAWGYGRARGGPWRVRQMLSDPCADDKIRRTIELVRTEGALAAYSVLAHDGDAHLKWLGPSFGTKLLYFAGYGSASRPKPLILDRLVGGALDGFGVYLKYNAWDPPGYEAYLSLAHAVAETADGEPHDVEWWLFQRGRALS